MNEPHKSESISWWKTELGEEEADAASRAIQSGHLSDGKITRQFEKIFARAINIPYAIAVPSGSAGLLLALMAVGVKPGDEVIVPAATWIATAHAAHLLGAKVILADTQADRPVVSAEEVEKLVSEKTRAIIVVHLGGRAVPMDEILSLAEKRNVAVVEDACQALFSKDCSAYLGTVAHIGCFSLGVAKLINTGQGGMVVTRNQALFQSMSTIKLNGVTTENGWETYKLPGFNFKYADFKAAIGQVQLAGAPDKIAHVLKIYESYTALLKGRNDIRISPINLGKGEVPLWAEVEVKNVYALQDYLKTHRVETKRFHVPLHRAPHFRQSHRNFPNADRHSERLMILPSGPAQPIANVERTCELIMQFKG